MNADHTRAEVPGVRHVIQNVAAEQGEFNGIDELGAIELTLPPG